MPDKCRRFSGLSMTGCKGVLQLLIAVSLLILPVGVFPLSRAPVVHAGENIWTWAGVTGLVEKIITDPLDPSVVYALVNRGMPSSRIVKSVDGGDTWSDITSSTLTTPIKDMAMPFSNPEVLWVVELYFNGTVYSKMHRTVDAGATWREISLPGDYEYYLSVAASPVDWRVAYVVVAELAGPNPTAESAILKTSDGGDTWTKVYGVVRPSNRNPVHDVVIAPSAPHIVLAKPLGFAGSDTPEFLKSTDSGTTWTTIPAPGYSTYYAALFDPKDSNTIYLACHSPGGWRSTDGGENWFPLANGLQEIGKGFVIDPDNTQVIHAANYEAGVVESLDGGTSWSQINTGIEGLIVDSIAIASRQPLEIYAGLQGAGVWKMTRTTIQDFSITVNDGALFTDQTAVTLTLTAPSGTDQMQISNDGGFGGAVWESYVPTKPWTLTAYGDHVIPRSVYTRFNTGGQVSSVYLDDIVLDQTPPTGSVQFEDVVASLTTHQPVSPGVLASTHATTTTHTVYLPMVAVSDIPGFRPVRLLLNATDDVSGVSAMIVSTDSSFSDAEWQAYTKQLDWYVSRQGTTTVYAKYEDWAGNRSQVYSAAAGAP